MNDKVFEDKPYYKERSSYHVVSNGTWTNEKEAAIVKYVSRHDEHDDMYLSVDDEAMK